MKAGAFSNISYDISEDTGYTEEEWNELSDKERDEILQEFVWNDIDVWTETIEEEDDEDGILF